MNASFQGIASTFRHSVRDKIWKEMIEMKTSHSSVFSDEALIRLAQEKNFDDEKVIQDLFEKVIRVLHNEMFK